jgi:hypothetical protein
VWPSYSQQARRCFTLASVPDPRDPAAAIYGLFPYACGPISTRSPLIQNRLGVLLPTIGGLPRPIKRSLEDERCLLLADFVAEVAEEETAVGAELEA